LFDQDECWFSRFAQPNLSAWRTTKQPLRLVQRQRDKSDKAPKAMACFGAVRQDTHKVYLSFCAGQPSSEPMWAFIIHLLAVARAEGKRVVVIIWDNASWHLSQRIRRWIRDYNRAAKEADEPRLLVHGLPSKSPWLNPIEPRWVHAKRAVCEPDGQLTPSELRRRIVQHFEVEPFDTELKVSA
jgi:transposase